MSEIQGRRCRGPKRLALDPDALLSVRASVRRGDDAFGHPVQEPGHLNTDIALYTSWLYLPFVIKPLWSPFVDMFRSKRWWIVWLELLIGSAFALVALTLPTSNFFN